MFCTLDDVILREPVCGLWWTGYIMAPRRGSNPQNLTWTRGLCRCVKLSLETGRVYLNSPDSSDTITRVRVRGEEAVRAGEKTGRC